MDKLLTVDDVAEILQVSRRTAYTYMGKMLHLNQPLRVSESALRAWIAGRTVDPEQEKKKGRRTEPRPMVGESFTGYHIPRRRAQ